MAAADSASLAYLAYRKAGCEREVGVVGHGPRGLALARSVAGQVRAWDRGYRHSTARFTLQPATDSGPLTRQFTFRTPHSWLAVDWE